MKNVTMFSGIGPLVSYIYNSQKKPLIGLIIPDFVNFPGAGSDSAIRKAYADFEMKAKSEYNLGSTVYDFLKNKDNPDMAFFTLHSFKAFKSLLERSQLESYFDDSMIFSTHDPEVQKKDIGKRTDNGFINVKKLL